MRTSPHLRRGFNRLFVVPTFVRSYRMQTFHILVGLRVERMDGMHKLEGAVFLKPKAGTTDETRMLTIVGDSR